MELPSGESTEAIPTPTSTQVVVFAIDEPDEKRSSLLGEIAEYVAEAGPPTRVEEPVVTPGAKVADLPSASVLFSANPASVTAGGCSTLSWRVEGVKAYWVDGQPGAGASGSTSVCPSETKTFELKYQISLENNLVKTFTKIATVNVNHPLKIQSSGSSASTGAGSVSSSGDNTQVCNGYRSELDYYAQRNDVIGILHTNELMQLWRCDSDLSFIPSHCDLLSLFKRWAQADGDVARAIELDQEMQQAGCR